MFTGYQVARIVNAAIADQHAGHPVPPQMIYTYIKKGMIKSYLTPAGQRVVSQQEAVTFTKVFVFNRKAAQADAIANGAFGPFITPAFAAANV
jgi:hypothetical protein